MNREKIESQVEELENREAKNWTLSEAKQYATFRELLEININPYDAHDAKINYSLFPLVKDIRSTSGEVSNYLLGYRDLELGLDAIIRLGNLCNKLSSKIRGIQKNLDNKNVQEKVNIEEK